MLEDKQNKRLLLEDGTSLVSTEVYIKHFLKNGEEPVWARVVESDESRLYDFFYGNDISFKEDEYRPLENKAHVTTDKDIELLMDVIEGSDRFDGSDAQLNRISKELDFYERTGNITFLLKVVSLIHKFETSGIVWGIGRGSACSSLVLYLLKVHDVNPLRYDIKFSELSKDIEDD